MKFEVQIDEVATPTRNDIVIEVDSIIDLENAIYELEKRGKHPDDIFHYFNKENGIKIITHYKYDSDRHKFECNYSQLN